MNCPECGTQVDADEKFCGNCGAPLANQEQTPPPAAEPETPLGGETIVSPPIALEAPEPEETPEPAAAPEPEAAPEPVPPAEEADFELPVVDAPQRPPEPAVAPPPPPAAAPPPAEGEGKSKTGLIIGIVAAVLILLCCCCVAGVIIFLLSDAGADLLYELGLGMVAPALQALI